MGNRRMGRTALALLMAASVACLAGCSEEGLRAFTDAAIDVYEAVGHKSVAMGEDHRAYSLRYDFHHGNWAGSSMIEVNGGTPYFTYVEMAAGVSMWAEPVWEIRPAGQPKSVCAYVAPGVSAEPSGDAVSDPPGWQRAEYPGAVDGGLLYRRVGILPEALGGDGTGCITGTAWMATAMDGLVRDISQRIPEEGMLWRAEAFYEGLGKVAEGVLVEAWALDGSWSCCYYIHNVQPGIGIDYSDGFSWLEKAGDPRAAESDGTDGGSHGGGYGDDKEDEE